jgi:hypothetical protein
VSYSEIKIARPNGDVEDYRKLQNSWGWAPRIWQPIYDRYFHPKPTYSWKPQKPYDSPIGMPKQDLDRFWRLYQNPAMPRFVRRVFVLTFDTAVLPAAEFEITAKDLVTFDKTFPVPDAIVFSGTSVNSTWNWVPVPPLNGDGESIADEWRPWNIDTDGGDLVSTMVPVEGE